MKKGFSCLIILALLVSSFALFSLSAAATEEEFKTRWSYVEDFPTVQGENGFTMLAGDQLDSLSGAEAQFVEGVQWNVGGANFAVLNKGFMMPNLRRYAAFKWVAPYSGVYELDYSQKWFFEDGSGSGNGYGIIIKHNDTELFTGDYTKETLEENNEGTVSARLYTFKDTLELVKGDEIYVIMDSMQDPGWDMAITDFVMTFKTQWSYVEDFPTVQGENGFTMLAGDQLDSLSGAEAQFVEGVQWNVGGANFAVLNKGFMMPNLRRYAAFKWVAPYSGTYNIDYSQKWFFEDGSGSGNGYGIVIKHNDTELFTGDYTKETLEENNEGTVSAKLYTFEDTLELAKGDEIYVIMDSKQDPGWDMAITTFVATLIGKPAGKVVRITHDVNESTDLVEEDTLQLYADISFGEESDLVWSSSDEDVATVSSTGLVTAVGVGEAVITAKLQSVGDESAAQITITVSERGDYVVTISGNTTIKAQKTTQLTATITEGTYEGEIAWTSLNPDIATVDENGLVTGIKAGTATIRANAGGIKDEVQITVLPAVDLSISGGTLCEVGKTKQLTAVVQNADPGYTVNWSSSDTDIAEVSSDGLVTAKAVGCVAISIEVEGYVYSMSFKCFKVYEDVGTTWDYYDDFPKDRQGQNSFYIYWGESNSQTEANLEGLSTDFCVPTEGEDLLNAPEQWKGGETYATMAQTFLMPGNAGISAVGFKAPVGGTYRISLYYEWTMAAKVQIADKADAIVKGFNGVLIGLAKYSNGTFTIVYEQDADFDYLTSPATEKTLKEIFVNLAEDDMLFLYVDAKIHGGWDQYDVQYSITNEEYDGPKEKAEDDTEAPTITITGTVPVTGKVGETVELPGADASDDKTVNPEIIIEVRDPNGEAVELLNNMFAPSVAGEYTIIYYAVDDAGNESQKLTFTLNVTSDGNESGARSCSCSGGINDISVIIACAILLVAACAVMRKRNINNA